MPLLMRVVALIGALVLGGLRHLVQSLDYEALMHTMATTPLDRIALAVLATMVSALALTGCDFSVLRCLDIRMPRPRR